MLYDCWYSYMRGRELSVNIGQLEHVVEVIRFSSFALAAKARHASPQALSKAVSESVRLIYRIEIRLLFRSFLFARSVALLKQSSLSLPSFGRG